MAAADNRVLSLGYNGFPIGCSDDEFPWEREGKSSYDTKYNYVCHAELNSILNFPGNKKDLEGAKIYVDLFPCSECAKAIIQVGIKKVIYLNDKYNGTDDNLASKHLFDKCNVEYVKLDVKNHKNISLSLDSKGNNKIKYK